MIKNALIMGFGNVTSGDLGVSCYVLEALGHEGLPDSIRLEYAGERTLGTSGLIYGTDLVIMVGPLILGGRPGRIHVWPRRVFDLLLPSLTCENEVLRRLALELAIADFTDGSPREILFLWIEPGTTDGFGLSPQVQKAMWRAIWIIKEKLVRCGLLPEGSERISPLYRVQKLKGQHEDMVAGKVNMDKTEAFRSIHYNLVEYIQKKVKVNFDN